MRFLKSDSRLIGVLLVLAITQLIGWGTIGLPAVVGRDLGADLGLSLPAVFAGSSVLYVTMGLCAPWLAKAFARHGARKVMMVGTVVSVPGYIVLFFAREPILYFAGWVVLGMGGSATLSTGAYIMLNEVAGRGAKNAIGGLMLVTGLSSSIFWPTTSFLSAWLGWRGTCLVYAAMMLAINLPLYAFVAPRRKIVADDGGEAVKAAPPPAIPRSTFGLVVCVITMNAFVNFGIGAILIELLRAEGLAPAQALAFGSMLGVIQVSARGLDFLGGGRWDGITTGLVAGTALPVAMMLLDAERGRDLGGRDLHPALWCRQRRDGGGAGDDPAGVLRPGRIRQGDVDDRIAAQSGLRDLAAASRRPAHPVRQPRRAWAHPGLFLRNGADPGLARPTAAALGCGSRDLSSTG